MKTLTIRINSPILQNALNNPLLAWFFGCFFGYLGWIPRESPINNYKLIIGVLLLFHLFFLVAMQSQDVE